jgi:hypothetical protein
MLECAVRQGRRRGRCACTRASKHGKPMSSNEVGAASRPSTVALDGIASPPTPPTTNRPFIQSHSASMPDMCMRGRRCPSCPLHFRPPPPLNAHTQECRHTNPSGGRCRLCSPSSLPPAHTHKHTHTHTLQACTAVMAAAATVVGTAVLRSPS